MEITQKNKKRVLRIIARTMLLQEHAKPGEFYGAEYSGIINGIKIWKAVTKETEALGFELQYLKTVYLGEDYGTQIEELEKTLTEEEKEHDLI